MTNRLIILLAGTALTVAACAKHDNTNNVAANDVNMTDNGMAMNGMDMNNMDMNAAAPAPTNAQGFVNAAAASDNFEISSSKLAATSGTSAAVKAFAARMIAAHTASTAKLKTTIAGMNPAVTPDDTLSPAQQQSLDSLKGLKGSAFDTAYASAQVDAHQKTLDLLKTYSASGDNADLKTFANGMIPTVTAHLNMAKGLK